MQWKEKAEDAMLLDGVLLFICWLLLPLLIAVSVVGANDGGRACCHGGISR